MAHTGPSSQLRSLTLTEELEKLEQSITLTLQEIDHNFSRAHRIVTSSILPIVEQYAHHSKDVWEGSKFWKQFFESSANVSLSGYEEQPSTHEGVDETVTEDSNTTTHTTLETSQSYETPSAQHISTDSIQDLDLSNLTISPSHSTPRPTKTVNTKAKPEPTTTFADYPSPYEALRQQVGSSEDATKLSPAGAPETPGKPAALFDSNDIAMTPQSSPFLPPPLTSIPRPSTARKKTDPLLHRVLDRNYRVQATPMASNRYGLPPSGKGIESRPAATPATSRRNKLFDSIVSSSPEIAAPELHAEIFSSPVRKPRKPGVSVLTPGKARANTTTQDIWDSDDEFEEEDQIGQSPPKTIQFHVPQSRLLKTPAKEASKRIVEDLLLTAGMGREYDDLTDDIDIGELDENSPSVIRKAAGFEDESF